ncbi:uncharacterized protein LOC129609234 [Condylostylus longicornis]|uniref:uncharacterized protein LOC129609234 n=1 Tax=Condylostylus longicornis TaxID=2530218 RepID=UPI00244DC78D|nr:uncharacterized protein LOC129609234 [Condylostylus longicornis]
MERKQELYENLIENYKQFPCLWDIKCEGYKNRVLKDEAYENLLPIYQKIDPNANLECLKKKINSMRTSFRRELCKVRNSKKKTGSAPEDVHTPTLWYYDLFHFLIEDESGREGIDNIDFELENMVSIVVAT